MNATSILPGHDEVCLPNETRKETIKHASRGGRAYPTEMREQVLQIYLQGGLNALNTPSFNWMLSAANSWDNHGSTAVLGAGWTVGYHQLGPTVRAKVPPHPQPFLGGYSVDRFVPYMCLPFR